MNATESKKITGETLRRAVCGTAGGLRHLRTARQSNGDQ